MSKVMIQNVPPMACVPSAGRGADRKTTLFSWMEDCINVAGMEHLVGGMTSLSERIHCGEQLPAETHGGAVVSYPIRFFTQSYHVEGMPIALHYLCGKLTNACLEADEYGMSEDVIEQARFVDGVIQNLHEPKTCIVWGKITCLKSDFEVLQRLWQAGGFPVPSTVAEHAAIGIRLEDTSKVKGMRLRFVADNIVGDDDSCWDTEIMLSRCIEKLLGFPHVSETSIFDYDDLPTLEAKGQKLDLPVNGVVVAVNDIKVQQSLEKLPPRLLLEFIGSTTEAIVSEITWSADSAGLVVPRAMFPSVRMNDRFVSHASLHTLGYILHHRVGVGTTVRLRDAANGGVEVSEVLAGRLKSRPEFPDFCPSCRGQLRVSVQTPAADGEMENWKLVCDDKVDCPAQSLDRLMHFLAAIGIKGISKQRVASLNLLKFVRRPGDFFTITEQDCRDAGMSERHSLLMVAFIHMVADPHRIRDIGKLRLVTAKVVASRKRTTLDRLLYGLAMNGITLSDCRKLSRAFFGDLDCIRCASLCDIAQVPGLEPGKAVRITDYLDRHHKELDALVDHFTFTKQKMGHLFGFEFVMNGTMEVDRHDMQDKIRKAGGRVRNRLTDRTNYLVCGDSPDPQVERDAVMAGVKVISEFELDMKIKFLTPGRREGP